MNRCRVKNLSHDCLGIFCRINLFYLFIKKNFEPEVKGGGGGREKKETEEIMGKL